MQGGTGRCIHSGALRIFSGIQPTGQKHLGNYIGAIRQYVEGQARRPVVRQRELA